MKKWPSVEELMRMAKTDPEGLENFRQREIESLIEGAPKEFQRRLRGLQFEVDCRRSIASNPLSSCIAVSKMMQDSLLELNRALNGVSGHKSDDRRTGPRRAEGTKTADTGQVIPFPANF